MLGERSAELASLVLEACRARGCRSPRAVGLPGKCPQLVALIRQRAAKLLGLVREFGRGAIGGIGGIGNRIQPRALALERRSQCLQFVLQMRSCGVRSIGRARDDIEMRALSFQGRIQFLRLVLQTRDAAIGGLSRGRDSVQAPGLAPECRAELLRIVPQACGRSVRGIGRDRQCLDASSDCRQTIALRGKRRTRLARLILERAQASDGGAVRGFCARDQSLKALVHAVDPRALLRKRHR